MNYLHRCRVGKLEGEYVLIFNFFRNLRSTIDQFKPSKVFIVLDGHPKHRYELFSDYKANRIIKVASQTATIDKVFASAEIIKQLLLYIPVTILSHMDFEADDIVFSFVENIKDENIIVISSDSDYIQLLQKGYKNCQIYNPIKKIYMEAPHYLYVQHKSLVGDKSDNIPRLISDKMAIEYCTNISSFKKYMSIEENRSLFTINRRLIEFANIPEEEIIIEDGISNFHILRQNFIEMEFNSITNPNSWEKYVSTFDCLKY